MPEPSTDGTDHDPDNLPEFIEAFEGADGVGPKTCRVLATEFGRVRRLADSDDERIARTVGDPTNQADRKAIEVLKGVDEIRDGLKGRSQRDGKYDTDTDRGDDAGAER